MLSSFFQKIMLFMR